MNRFGFMRKIKLTRKGKIASACLCLAIIGGIAAFGGQSSLIGQLTGNNDIPEHDGDILVDSLNVTDDGKAEKNKTDTVASDDGVDATGDVYFQEARATINMDRQEVISMLSETIENSTSDSEKKGASEQKARMLKYMEQESVIESLISNKGLPECLVVITDNGINVTVNTKKPAESDVAKICSIVMNETGRPADDIVIQGR